MNRHAVAVLGVRLALPVVAFGANLLLLRHFGATRYAVLATLLQGALLASVLLKFGRDDALLYGRGSTSEKVVGWQFTLPAVLVLVSSLALPHHMTGLWRVLVTAVQLLLLGGLSAALAIAAMRLQVLHHRPWYGNLVFVLAGPLASWLGTSGLALWWVHDDGADPAWFAASLGLGYGLGLLLLSRSAAPAAAEQQKRQPEADAPAAHGRALWLLQILDVLLLSGDLIMLGLLDRRSGLELYIAASRLAAASAFINLALEQVFATLHRQGRRWAPATWLLQVGMLAVIPAYGLALWLCGLRPGTHYDGGVLVAFMAGAAVQVGFVQKKVDWASVHDGAGAARVFGAVLAVAAVGSMLLTWVCLTNEAQPLVRAMVFSAFAVAVRYTLTNRMRRLRAV